MRSRLNAGRLLDLVQRAARALTASRSTGTDEPAKPSKPSKPSKPPRPSKPSKPSKPSTRPTPATAGGPRPAAIDIELDGTRFEYSPSMDGDPDPGEVVWTWVPYEDDSSQGKDRPVVVIGRRSDRLVGVALTSKRHDDEAQLEVGTGPWDRERRPSYAKLDRVLALDPDQVRREGAVLAKARFDDLVMALRQLHGLVERPR